MSWGKCPGGNVPGGNVLGGKCPRGEMPGGGMPRGGGERAGGKRPGGKSPRIHAYVYIRTDVADPILASFMSGNRSSEKKIPP